MRTLALTLAVLVAATVGCESGNRTTTLAAPQEKVMTPTGMLRHVVNFKFKEDVTDEQIAEVERAFAALPDRIDSIRGFEYGHTDISVEGLNQDYTHTFLLTFDDVEGLKEYMPHPAHQEFGELVGPLLEEAFVLDYYVRDSYE